jgi:tRNA pseudouridine13 synthase
MCGKYNYLNKNWQRASGPSLVTATIRSQPADFFVEENLGFAFSGDGEHVYVLVEKTGQNTTLIAERLARFASVRPQSVGYAGLKDRNAVTRQWFSIQLPKVDPADWQKLESADMKVLEVSLHNKKLRKGALKQNHFKLLLRDVEGLAADIDERLNWIRHHGVPNYFGPQRFGRQGDNVDQAVAWLEGHKKPPGRHLKGLYLSSMRSYLFNEILSSRVEAQFWNKGIGGDILMLNDTNSCFLANEITDDLCRRLQQQDIHPAATLYGVGGLSSTGEARQLELHTLSSFPQLTAGLQDMRIKKAWRSMRLLVNNLEWSWIEKTQLLLSFSLPPGSYATSVLAEL